MKFRMLALFGVVAVFFIAGLAVFHKEARWSTRYLFARENPEPAAPPKIPPCPNCNLILISLDTLRADRLDFLGSERGLTPNLDKIAARSFNYVHAYANAFFTTPSHMTLFTSLYPQTHQVEAQGVRVPGRKRTLLERHKLDKNFVTLAEVLRDNNYATYWDGPLKLNHLAREDGFGRGFDHFAPSPFRRDLSFTKGEVNTFDTRVLAPLDTKNAKTFLFLHSYVTHLPYMFSPPDKVINTESMPYERAEILKRIQPELLESPGRLLDFEERTSEENILGPLGKACTNFADMKTCFDKFVSEERFWEAVGQWQLRKMKKTMRDKDSENDAELDTYKLAYGSGVRLLDKEIGELWADLEKRGALKNTMVIFFSDHGEQFFEHGDGSHSSFHEHTAHVPLLIYHPMAEGQRVEEWVSLVDVMPTILETLGLPSPKQTQGVSLSTPRPSIVSGYSLGNDYIRDANWKLIRKFDGSERLFYLPADPHEKSNLLNLRTPWTKSAAARLSLLRSQRELMQSL